MKQSDSETIKEILSALADDEFGGAENITRDEVIELACKDQDAMSAWRCMHLARDVMQADYHSALKPDFAVQLSARIANEEVGAGYDAEAGDAWSATSSSPVSINTAGERQIGRRRQHNRVNASITSAARRRAPVAPQPFALWKPVAGLGLAASLAGATFLFSQLWVTEKGANSPEANTQVAQVTQSDAGGVVVADASATQVNGNNQVELQPLPLATQTASDASTLQAAVGIGNSGTRWRMGSAELPRNEQIEKRLNTLLTNHLEDASMGRVHGVLSHSRVVGYDTAPASK